MGYRRTPEIGNQEHRIRLYLDLMGRAYAVGPLIYNEGFTSPSWPRQGYVITRPDAEHVLSLLDQAREQVAKLQTELKPHRERELREALMLVPEGRQLLINKAEAEEAFLRKQETAYWDSMPTTVEEEESAASE